MMHLIEPTIPAPSAEDILSIGCGFLEVSSEFLGHFIQMAGLKPGSDVLDVGCGCGRMAYMLAHYLDPAARYEGIDIVDHLVAWAQQTITPQFSNFTFQKADIYNKCYNPKGTFAASKYRFPYEDESFDLIFLTSVSRTCWLPTSGTTSTSLAACCTRRPLPDDVLPDRRPVRGPDPRRQEHAEPGIPAG